MRTCRYCKKEDEHTVCIYCDGKHSARAIRKILLIERTFPKYNYKNSVFNEESIKRLLFKINVIGLEGFNKEEKNTFFSAFTAEWTRLKSQELLGQ